jgi:hypothetical protein
VIADYLNFHRSRRPAPEYEPVSSKSKAAKKFVERTTQLVLESLNQVHFTSRLMDYLDQVEEVVVVTRRDEAAHMSSL